MKKIGKNIHKLIHNTQTMKFVRVNKLVEWKNWNVEWPFCL